jgi:hypothetical protein
MMHGLVMTCSSVGRRRLSRLCWALGLVSSAAVMY